MSEMVDDNEWRQYANGVLTVLCALTVYCRRDKKWQKDHHEVLKAAENVLASAGFNLDDYR